MTSHIYILHELLADWSDFLGERRGEHHHLLLVGRHSEDLLHITAHVCNSAHGSLTGGIARVWSISGKNMSD